MAIFNSYFDITRGYPSPRTKVYRWISCSTDLLDCSIAPRHRLPRVFHTNNGKSPAKMRRLVEKQSRNGGYLNNYRTSHLRSTSQSGRRRNVIETINQRVFSSTKSGWNFERIECNMKKDSLWNWPGNPNKLGLQVYVTTRRKSLPVQNFIKIHPFIPRHPPSRFYDFSRHCFPGDLLGLPLPPQQSQSPTVS